MEAGEETLVAKRSSISAVWRHFGLKRGDNSQTEVLEVISSSQYRISVMAPRAFCSYRAGPVWLVEGFLTSLTQTDTD